MSAQPDELPTEVAMRAQTFKTMCALERMAEAITDHLTADKKPAPEQNDAPAPNYNWRQEKGADFLFEGDVVITGDLVVKKNTTVGGTTTSVDTKHLTNGSPELKNIYDAITRFAKALSLVSQFGVFDSPGVFMSDGPRRRIADLAKITVCSDCLGSGWLARDETCDRCHGRGVMG